MLISRTTELVVTMLRLLLGLDDAHQRERIERAMAADIGILPVAAERMRIVNQYPHDYHAPQLLYR